MKTIYKYEFAVSDTVKIKTPIGARIISVGCQSEGDWLCVWAEVDSDAETSWQELRIFGTGHPMPTDNRKMCFIGTVQTPSGLVWHVYEQGARP